MLQKMNKLLPITILSWEKNKGLLSFLVVIFLLVIYFSFFNEPSKTLKAQPQSYSSVSSPKQKNEELNKVREVRTVKTRAKVPERSSKTSSVTNLTTNQEKMYTLLEVNTKAYLEHVVGPTMMKEYVFDPEGKVKLSIKTYFELSEQMIVDKFKNKIINTPLLDTIRNDTLDLRMIVYK
jgi:hypothetical protein